jgi:hypothetical protein
MHAMSGEEKYLRWAERIGDYYLLENPPHRSPHLRLRDHGGEIISGLAELFAAARRSHPAKAAAYHDPLRDLLDRVLEVGQLPDGMLANIIDPLHGQVVSVGLTDPKKGTNTNWGYTCNAHCTYDMVTQQDRYGDRIQQALRALPQLYMDDSRYQARVWRGSSDYFADFIENGIVLFNRYRVEGVEEWIARTVPRMWAFQKADGTVNGHYHDGSFGRTSVLVAWLCSEGLRAEPWRDDLQLGAVAVDGGLNVLVQAERPWSGRLAFDFPRWRDNLHLPVNYPRINELPEWYAVEPSRDYQLQFGDESSRRALGQSLVQGLPVELKGGQALRIVVRGAGATRR